MKKLDDPNFYNDPRRQSWFLKQHFEHEGRKLRFIIERNAYDSQNSAVVQIQDANTLGWLGLGSIPNSQIKATGSYVLKELSVQDKGNFLRDLAELQKIAKMLI